MKKVRISQNIQHQVRVGINQFSALWAKNWFKVSLITVITLVVIQKNFNFSFSLNNRDEITQNQPTTNPISKSVANTTVKSELDKESISIFDFTYYLISEVARNRDDNRVNDFSNIGLVINPDFVKKHKIDPKIVAEKQKIVTDYINRHKAIAKAEEKKFGIPASITLAQGLLESDAGGSRLARNNNNHFGIKCFSKTCTKGHCVNYTDDTHKDFFRNYESAWGSFRGHSLLLQKPRYKSLYKLKKTDYKGWAHGLRKAGYATDKRYGEKLIKLIEVLDLDEI